MREETREMIREMTARIDAAHAGGRHDLQRVLDTATAATMILGADGGDEAAEVARLVRALMRGVSSVFNRLKMMEDDMADPPTVALSKELGRLWGNPKLR